MHGTELQLSSESYQHKVKNALWFLSCKMQTNKWQVRTNFPAQRISSCSVYLSLKRLYLHFKIRCAQPSCVLFIFVLEEVSNKRKNVQHQQRRPNKNLFYELDVSKRTWCICRPESSASFLTALDPARLQGAASSRINSTRSGQSGCTIVNTWIIHIDNSVIMFLVKKLCSWPGDL